MKITHTESGKVVFVNTDIATLSSSKWGTNGSIGLGLLLDKNSKPECWVIMWQWGGDWNGFIDGDETNIEKLSGWEPGAIEEAISVIEEYYPECVDDMSWFRDWASSSRDTLDEIYLMNPHTGTVQLEEDWRDDFAVSSPESWGGDKWEDAELYQVIKVDCEWVEAK